jgi:Phytanoyl-CoA dioxygenase (PhyH)
MIEFIQHRISEAEIVRFREEGFFTSPLLADSSLAAVQGEVDRLWSEAGKRFDADQSWLANALINGVHKDSAVIRDALYGNPLVDVMTRLIGLNVKAASNQLAFKQPGDTRAFDWHQDNGYGPLTPEDNVTVWLALDDVTLENGCLWVIPGSHKDGLIEHGAARESERIAQVKDVDRAVAVPMRAGEALVFHGSLLHMSKGNHTDRIRRAYFCRYADADAIEIKTGLPRIGKLLRGASQFREVTECSELVCHPAASELQDQIHIA